jgi:CheY-like chemotaxis protein
MPTVLVVEDEANIRQFVAVNLKVRGYDIIEAASAEDGLLQLRNSIPDALILDVKLPGMSGWDMLKQVATDSDLPAIPVIILTASALITHPDEQVYVNITAKLIKPISTTDLILAVKKALNRDTAG